MTIDTREEAATLFRTKAFAVAIFLIGIFLVLFFVPLSKAAQILILGGWALLFILFYWMQYKRDYYYFYFSNNGDNLVFRFYSMRHFYGKPHSIEISRMNFYRYDIDDSAGAKKPRLLLFQKTPRGIAKYPPISLSLLTRNQQTELKRALYAASESKD